MEEEDLNEDKIVSSLNAVSTFEHVTPKQMAEEQQKDPTLELVKVKVKGINFFRAGIPTSHSR